MTGRSRRPVGPRPFVLGIIVGVVACAVIGGTLVLLTGAGDDAPNAGTSSDQPTTAASASTGSQPAGDAEESSDAERSSDDVTEGDGDEDAADDGAGSAGTSAGSPPTPAGPVPDGALVECPAPTREVRTAAELVDALDQAAPGASIHLADGTYEGAFVVTRPGTERAPIFLCGSQGAVLVGEGIRAAYVLHLRDVSSWRIVGFGVRNGQKGVVADGTTHSVIQQLTVSDIGDEGIHLRSHSSANAVLGNTVRRTGLRRDKFGEGIYVGSAMSNWRTYSGGGPDRSDNNLVQGNTISETTSEPIDVKEGTTGGRLIGNTLDGTGMSAADSLIDVKGNDWVIRGNTGRNAPEQGFQTHRILEGWGARNLFEDNSIGVDGDGDHIWVHDPDITDNRISCNNRSDGGGPLRTNVPCEP
jgi:hypothetical protein